MEIIRQFSCDEMRHEDQYKLQITKIDVLWDLVVKQTDGKKRIFIIYKNRPFPFHSD